MSMLHITLILGLLALALGNTLTGIIMIVVSLCIAIIVEFIK